MRIVCWTGLSLLVLIACSGEPDPGPAASRRSGPVAPATEPEPAAVSAVEAPPPGQARVILGSSLDATLEVETCRRDLGSQPDGEVPSEQVHVRASGTTAGQVVTLDVRRFRSQGASPTITDTVRIVRGPVDDPISVLEAQRFEVDGIVTDPRDADADDPLLRLHGSAIEASAVFAPPGAFADDGGLVAGVVAVTCDA